MKMVHYTKAEKIVLVDFSNLCYIAYFGYQKYQSYGHVYGFIEKLYNLIRIYENRRVGLVFALDNRPIRKHKLLPTYKQGRKKQEFDPKPDVMKLLKYFNCTVIQHKEEEADDVIASFCRNNASRDVTVDVVTSDRDIWQIAWRRNIRLLEPIKKRYAKLSDLEEKFGINDWTKLPLWKAMFGDSSDNIKPSVPRLRKKDVLPLIDESDGTIDSLYELFHDNKGKFTENAWLKIQNGRDDSYKNMKLVRLVEDIEYEEKYQKGNTKFIIPFIKRFKSFNLEQEALTFAGGGYGSENY